MARTRKLNYKFGVDISEAERKLKEMSNKIETVGKRMKSFGESTSKLAAPFVGLGVISAKAALDYDKAVDSIVIGTGAVGEKMEGLEASFKKIAAKVPQDMAQSSQAVADLNTRLGLTGEDLESLSITMLDASRMLGEDLGGMIAQSTKAMNDWGVSAKDSAGFMDMLFVASQETGISISSLSEQLYKFGSPLRQMGFDVETVTAMLGSFEKAGVNTELVMGSMRIALGKMAKAGIKDLPEALRASIAAIKNAKTSGEAATIALKVFGAKAGPDMAAAIREGRLEVDELVTSLGKSEGAINRTAEATDGFTEQMGRMKNQVALSLEPLGTKIVKIAEDYMPSLLEKLENFSADCDESTIKIIALTAGLGAGSFVLGHYTIALAGLVTNIGKLRIALTAFFKAHPMGLAALAAAGAGYITYKNISAKMEKIETEDMMRSALGDRAPRMPAKRDAKSMNEYSRRLKKEYSEYLAELQKISDEEAKRYASKTVTAAGIQKPKKPIPPDDDVNNFGIEGTGKKNTGPSAAERLVMNIQDRIKYLGEDGKSFLGVLDAWQAKLKPLSADWKAIEDLKLDIRSDSARKAGEEVAALIERMEKQKEMQAEIDAAVKEGEAKFYADLQWENSMGLLGDEEYLGLLKDRFAALSGEMEKLGLDISNVANWSDDMKQAFSDIQTKGGEIAGAAIDTFRKKMESGTITNAQYLSMLEALKQKFAEYPAVVKQCQDAIDAFNLAKLSALPSLGSQVKASWEDAQQSIARAPSMIGDAFTSAVVGTKSLSEAMLDLLQDIGAVIAKALIMKAIFGVLNIASSTSTVSDWHDAGNAIRVPTKHSGGVVGAGGATALVSPSVFIGAPRMHGGGISGLRSDEVPAILQRGEVVLPKGSTAAEAMSRGLFGLLGLKFHSGGVVGAGGTPALVSPSVFVGAPRMHSGGIAGLRSDEVPAILPRGGVMLPKGDAGAARASENRGGDSYYLTIQAVDAQSFVKMLQNNKGVLESLIVNGIQRGGPLRMAIKGAM
ncbi:phage tail tape measure protein [Synergistes jonesii]|uniref:phage tail tape measure protein n=1 Tax=Synergistes jonesii TaxID=2754 RepID=UPI000871DB97|nr:phage tail tape measure protein [Synergistes jonesii]OFB60684.1 hypothetical protein JS72_11910 [Synergistes jonesii]OFB66120.1 hypothetical protein JS79_02980 [Synergistes jonesii]